MGRSWPSVKEAKVRQKHRNAAITQAMHERTA
jgi:hypothetical protein